ncbi:MAG TPA: hypothetical protein PKJ63_01500 [Cyclobacteriaceae bacterium]|nr:hypothetical protein [Cyclobacteriaceae bacterium]
MATENKKIMLGKNLKASKKFGNKIIEGAICLDTLQAEEVQKLTYEYEGKTYLNVKVVQYKEKSKFDATHYIEVDQFVPENKKGE